MKLYHDVILVTKEGCPSCINAKVFFKTRKINIDEIPEHEYLADIHGYYKNLKKYVPETFNTYPIIFIVKHSPMLGGDCYFIGGYSDLMALPKISSVTNVVYLYAAVISKVSDL